MKRTTMAVNSVCSARIGFWADQLLRMGNYSDGRIARINASIGTFEAERSRALATAAAKAQEARDHNAKAEAYEALARDAQNAAAGLEAHAGAPAVQRGLLNMFNQGGSFTGTTGSALGQAVSGVTEIHALTSGAWTGSAAEAFSAARNDLGSGVERPTHDVRAYFQQSSTNCSALAAQATAKGAEHRALAIAAFASAAAANSRADVLASSIRSAHQNIAALKAAAP